MPIVQDLTWLDTQVQLLNSATAVDVVSSISDPGTGAYPILRNRGTYIEHQSSAVNVQLIPMSRVIKLNRTLT